MANWCNDTASNRRKRVLEYLRWFKLKMLDWLTVIQINTCRNPVSIKRWFTALLTRWTCKTPKVTTLWLIWTGIQFIWKWQTGILETLHKTECKQQFHEKAYNCQLVKFISSKARFYMGNTNKRLSHPEARTRKSYSKGMYINIWCAHIWIPVPWNGERPPNCPYTFFFWLRHWFWRNLTQLDMGWLQLKPLD